jgi:hypothetical protein
MSSTTRSGSAVSIEARASRPFAAVIVVLVELERGGDQVGDVLVVVDDEDGRARRRGLRHRRPGLGRRPGDRWVSGHQPGSVGGGWATSVGTTTAAGSAGTEPAATAATGTLVDGGRGDRAVSIGLSLDLHGLPHGQWAIEQARRLTVVLDDVVTVTAALPSLG